MSKSYPKSPAIKQAAKVRETLEQQIARQRAARIARDGDGKKSVTESTVRVLDLEDELPFGRHRGRTIAEVIENDHGWLLWAADSIRDFVLSDEAQEMLDALNDPRRPPRAWEK